jgi:hypothetical protein
VLDDLIHPPERDQVPQPLLRAEEAYERALVLGRIGAPGPLVGDGGGSKVRIIEDGPLVAAGRERGGQIWLPDPLREPRPVRSRTEEGLQLVRHPSKLAHPVALGQ